MEILQVSDVKKTYTTRLGGNRVQALKGVTFSVQEGEYVAIMGESGSGKTTLLNILAALDRPTAGEVLLSGKNLETIPEGDLAAFRRDNLGFVFQEFNLLDTLTAFENIALALSIQNVPAAEITKRVHAMAEKLDIESVLSKYPYEMSGGQKQRVACARAMVTDPGLVLADEPTGALDSRSARMLLESFQTLNREMQATILMVTHDAFTASYAGRVIFIKDGKLFHELRKGNASRREFFEQIMDVVTLLGGDLNHAF